MTQATAKVNYSLELNPQFNSIEISFSEKPSEQIREALKALKFRWHGVKRVWYGYSTEAEAREAIEGKAAQGKASKPAWVSPRNIEDYIYAVRRYVYTKQTQSLRPSLDTDRICDPLVWYISTGRASTPFLCSLLQIQPWRVGRSLMKGGSVDEAINRIKDMVQRSAEKRLKG